MLSLPQLLLLLLLLKTSRHPHPPHLDHDVLQHAAEPDGLEDLRLAVGLQPDALGVAAALDVEDAVIAPAVLVVADQRTVGLGGEGGLAGAWVCACVCVCCVWVRAAASVPLAAAGNCGLLTAEIH